MTLDRRQFFLSSGVALAAPLAPLACAPAGGSIKVPPSEGRSTAEPASVDAIAAAEQVMGVEYTSDERALIAQVLDEQLDLIRKRRALELPFELAPAVTFDPVLPRAIVTEDRGGTRWAPPPRGGPPKDEAAIAFAPLGHLHHWLRRRKITSAALTDIYLGRLKKYGPALECVVTLTEELARAQAAEADREIRRGRIRGPLHGIPYGVKDLFDTKEIPTTWGAEPYQGRVPARDAVVVERLARAGAVLCAKLTLGALAYGDIWFGGRTRNPWNRKEGSSGSSAGSASATAAGLVGFAIGTETLGSIVSPSNRCGTAGLRPTFGRVPRTGAMPLCWSLDKIGPLCRTVEDCVMVLDAIHGRDDGDPVSRSRGLRFDARRGVRGRVIGYAREWFEGKKATGPDIAALQALRKMGASLVEVELPRLPFEALLPILLAEAAAAFEPLTLANQDDTLKWQDKEAWPNTFRTARFISAVDLVQAERLRRKVMEEMGRLMAQVDLIVSPPNEALLLATNFTGHPSLTLRAGFVLRRTRAGFDDKESDDGPRFRVPRCVTLWGRLYDEGTLCEVGRALEQTIGLWDEKPPLDG
jgi:Asp-tRNA(Asn)/Glu-tRNA(Gln) amidotransferase A subunit family amidase